MVAVLGERGAGHVEHTLGSWRENTLFTSAQPSSGEVLTQSAQSLSNCGGIRPTSDVVPPSYTVNRAGVRAYLRELSCQNTRVRKSRRTSTGRHSPHQTGRG